MGTMYREFVNNVNIFFQEISTSYENFQLEKFLQNKNQDDIQVEQSLLDNMEEEVIFFLSLKK